MKLSTLISHSAELTRIIIKSYQASDKIASQYFRQKKYIGSKERRFISEITFSTLRNLFLSQYCLTKFPIDKEKMIVIINLILNNYFNFDRAIDAQTLFEHLPNYNNKKFPNELLLAIIELSGESSKNAEIFINLIKDKFINLENHINNLKNKPHLDKMQIEFIQFRYSMPSLVLMELHNNNFSKRSWKEIIEIAESTTNSAPLTIRVDLNITTRKDILSYLSNKNIDAFPTAISPAGIIIKKRYQLTQLDIYKSGFFEIQDEGSQLISYALAPENNSSILDAAAGAGGKTLHLASLTNSQSRITASDIDTKRLKEFSKRLRKYNYKSIEIKFIHPSVFTEKNKNHKDIFNKKFDYILIDAPCSGMGTVRRMPMQKYRLNKKLLKKLQTNQLKILNYYSRYLRPNGILVYATCSIMPDENEYLIDRFLENNPDFKPDSLFEAFQKNNIFISNLSKQDFFINLTPNIHKTDGFFIARFKKRVNL